MRASEQTSMQNDSRFATAGEWLLKLQSDDIAQEEFSAWLQWYETDPLNRVAFEEAQAAFEAARGLSSEDRSRWAKQLIGERPEDSVIQPMTAVPLPPSVKARWLDWTRSLSWSPRYVVVFAATTTIGIFLGLATWFLSLRGPQSAPLTAPYQPPLATHRAETLPDGSVVRLGARSSISLNFSRETRYLVLEGGEAFFSVAKDAARPFIVQAGRVSARAVGTQFNVRRAAESTTVAVSEGVVDVIQERITRSPKRSPGEGSPQPREIRLSAGEQITLDAPSVTLAITRIEPTAVSAWQMGRLEFV